MSDDTPNMAGSDVIRRAMHTLDCQDAVAMAITNWARVMEVSRLEAARQVLHDARHMTDSMDRPKVDPDLVDAARKALRRDKESTMTTKLTARQKDKLIEAAQNAITFTVEGSGQFPVDMLRYDLCWPASEADSARLHNYSPLSQPNLRSVNLRGLKLPTPARWGSFGWRVEL